MQQELNTLDFLELNIMLEHIRAGEAHLRDHLNSKQFNELMTLGNLKEEQRTSCKSDPIEKSSNVALSLNGILTGLYGSWLGLSGFAGVSLGSLNLLIFYTSLATITGTFIGYFSYKSIKRQAKNSIIKQKLSNIQLKLLDKINKKRKEDLQKLIEKVHTLLTYINHDELLAELKTHEQTAFFEEQHLSTWLNQLNKLITAKVDLFPHDVLHELLAHDIKQCINYLKITLSKNLDIKVDEIKSKTSADKEIVREHWEVKQPDNNTSAIKALTKPSSDHTNSKNSKSSWIQRNFYNILVGFFPTLFGTFGSMFVFLTAPPNLAKEFGKHKLYSMLTNPTVKLISFSLAILITAYFAISFIYNNRKAYKRDSELEKTQEQITQADEKMIELNSKINVLEKVKADLHRVKHLFTIVEKVDTYLKTCQSTS